MPPKGADEGSGFGFPFVGRAVLQGFALQGEFLFHVEKEPKDAGGRRRGELRSPMTAFPQPPITGVTPWGGQSIPGAQNLSGGLQFLPPHRGLAVPKLQLVRFTACAWLCRAIAPGANSDGRPKGLPYPD